MNLSKLVGLSQIEIIRYMHNQLKHNYPLIIKFYTKMFHLHHDVLYHILKYIDLKFICNIGKIVFLYLYYFNPQISLFIQYHSYLSDFLLYFEIQFNKGWKLFSNQKYIEKYKKIYFDFISFNEKDKKMTFYMYLYKLTTIQERKKILETLKKCNCCNSYNYEYDEFTYNKYYCPCSKIIYIINEIEKDLYYFKLYEEYDEYDIYYKLKKNEENEKNKYLHISKLLSQDNYEDLELGIEDLEENDWIYYENINQYKNQ